MKLVQLHRSFNSSCKTMMALVLSFSCGMVLINSASAQNPWLAADRPLIEEGSQLSTNRNTWQDKTLPKEEGVFDESKYPPLEEEETLGTGVYGELPENTAKVPLPDYASSDGLQRFDTRALGEIPTYPGSSRGYSGGNYGRYQNPGLNNRYQTGNQSGFWPGNSGMYGMPFGGGSGSGFPFSGGNGSGSPLGWGNGSGSGFPFGGGNNGWMPFSNSGFW